jgi:hypothetical protein
MCIMVLSISSFQCSETYMICFFRHLKFYQYKQKQSKIPQNTYKYRYIYILFYCSNEPKVRRKHLWKVHYKKYSLQHDSLPKVANIGNSCFWLTIIFKSSPLEAHWQMNLNLVENIYGRSSIKIAHFVADFLNSLF